MDPFLAHVLAGGAIGTGLGALGAEHGHRLHGALMGGLGGATLGSMTGSAHSALLDEARQADAWRRAANADARTHAGYAHARQQAGSPFGGGGRSPFDDFFSQHGSSFGGGSPPRGAPSTLHQEQLHDVAPWLQGVGSKADAKAAFRAQARQAHPDVGGSDAAMKTLNEQWARAQQHPDFGKLASAYAAGRDRAAAVFLRGRG